MMKVTCNHCGAKNELGRMFCMACGKRMSITTEDVNQAQVGQSNFKLGSVLRPIFVLLIVAVAGLMAWPKLPAEEGNESGKAALKARVGGKIGTLGVAARNKKEAKTSFNSAELNVYMRARVPSSASTNAAKSLSVRLDPTRLILLEQARWSFDVGGKTVGPIRFTREVACEPAGRIFKVKSTTIGHLPLPGFLMHLGSDPVVKSIALTPAEQIIEKQLTNITIRDGQLEITVGP